MTYKLTNGCLPPLLELSYWECEDGSRVIVVLVRVGVMAEGHGQHERHVVEPKQRIAHTDGQGERGVYDLVERAHRTIREVEPAIMDVARRR